MKIAITARGTDLDSAVDPSFGRAAFIIIVDSDNLEFEALDNSDNAGALKGAGIQAASRISNKGAEVLLTGHCGPKAFEVLKSGGVEVANGAYGRVRDMIEDFRRGNVSFTENPDA